MKRINQSGALNALLLPLIVTIILLIAAGAFAVWAYMGRQDYKNNVDSKVATAVEVAKDQEGKAKEADFAERSKTPFKIYTGPSEYGSINMQYPKTWSAYIAVQSGGDPLLNGYFSPGAVPNVQTQSSVFALRMQVTSQSYSTIMDNYNNQVESGRVTVQPYALPKLPNIVGSKVQGQIENNKNGTMIILALRDKTLKIWTESTEFDNDFNNNILPNFTFSP